MKKVLFFETNEFTGATRVTHTLAKAATKKFKVAFAKVGKNVIEDIIYAIKKEAPDILFSSFIRINSDVIKIGYEKGLYIIIRNDYNLADVSVDIRNNAIETYPFADEIIAQTEEMRNELISYMSIQPEKVRVMENPIDEEDIIEKAKAPNPFPFNDNFHFLWVGRIDPIKDITTLKKAFTIVHNKYPRTDLTLINDDPNPYRWMKNADCLVISSISEASPNVLRECLFLGTRVLSTDCSPTVRKLLPEEFICPPCNHIVMSRLMENMIIQNMENK